MEDFRKSFDTESEALAYVEANKGERPLYHSWIIEDMEEYE
jgi:hypothetical protein